MPEPIIELLRAFGGAFLGAVGFAMLVHVPGRSLLPSGIIAGMSYAVYWAVAWLGLPDPAAIFIGSLFGALSGHICARRMKTIRTIFLMSAIVPVVPGLALYRMMAYLGSGDTLDGANLGIQAMITIAMITLGLAMGAFLYRVIHRKTN